jgi:hypothetical protein
VTHTATAAPLGRERIPGATVLAAIGPDESYPVPCPRCIAGHPDGRTFRVLDVDDEGTAACRLCGLTLPGVLPALP